MLVNESKSSSPELSDTNDHKVERLKSLLHSLHTTGEGELLLRELIGELKEAEAEIIHDLAKENATIKTMLGGPTLAFAAADDDDEDA